MKCKSQLDAERNRLVGALAQVRTKLMSLQAGQEGWLPLTLDEAMLQGEIKAIDWAMTADTGGWPHDTWFQFLGARADAIRSMRRAGITFEEILETLNLSLTQAQLIAVFDDTDPKN
jgi:hypothetical protein